MRTRTVAVIRSAQSALLLTLLLLTTAGAHGQEKLVDHWVLADVVVGDDYPGSPSINKGDVGIEKLEGDGNGGRIRINLRCGHQPYDNNGPHTVIYEFTWKFSRNIGTMRLDDEFTASVEGARLDQNLKVCPPHNWTPFLGAGAAGGSGVNVLLANASYPSKPSEIFAIYRAFEHPAPSRVHNGRVFPESWENHPTGGTVAFKLFRAGPGGWLKFTLAALGSLPSVIYVYQPVHVGESDPSGKGGGTTGGGTTGGGTTGGGTTGGGRTGGGTATPGNDPWCGTTFPTPPPGSPEPLPGLSRMTLQAGQRRIKRAQLVEVPIYLVKSSDASNLNFEVRYDPAIVELVGDPTAGGLLGGTLFEANAAMPGLARLGFARRDGLSGTGPIAILTLRAVSAPGQVSPLLLTVTKINGPDRSVPKIDLVHGRVEVLSEDQPLTALDAREALRMSVGKIPENLRLDLDQDRKVTSLDATLILQEVNSR